MINYKNLDDAALAIKEQDQMEMILVRDHLTQAIHKLECDLQAVLGHLGDLEGVPVEYIMGFREESKNSIREFKNSFLELEKRISELEKAANMVAATPPAQSTQWGVPPMRPTTGRWQMPVLTKMDQPPPVQFQYLHPTQQTKPKLKGQQAGVATAATGAPRTPNYLSLIHI